jgi:hypothetical protein
MNVVQEKTKVTIEFSNEEADALAFITDHFLQKYGIADENSETATELNEELSSYESEWIKFKIE